RAHRRSSANLEKRWACRAAPQGEEPGCLWRRCGRTGQAPAEAAGEATGVQGFSRSGVQATEVANKDPATRLSWGDPGAEPREDRPRKAGPGRQAPEGRPRKAGPGRQAPEGRPREEWRGRTDQRIGQGQATRLAKSGLGQG